MVDFSWICLSFPFKMFVTMMMMQGRTVAGLNNCDDCLVFGRSGGRVDYNGTGTNVPAKRHNGHKLCTRAQ